LPRPGHAHGVNLLPSLFGFRGRLIPLIATVAAVIATASSLKVLPAIAAPWYVAYEQALEALASGHPDRAVPLLEEALAGRNQPGLRVRTYGTRFIDYFPQYHLGQAHLAMGHDAKAAEYLRQAEAAGVIQKVPALYDDLRRDLALVESRLAPPRALSAAESLFAAARHHSAAGRLAEAESDLHRAAGQAATLPSETSLRAAIDSALAQVVARREESARSAGTQVFVDQALSSARAYLSQGDHAHARDMVDKALAADPGNAEALFLKESIAAAASAENKKVDALIADAETKLAAGDFSAAQERLEEVRRLAPADPRLAAVQERLAARSREVEVQAEVRSLQEASWEEAIAAGRQAYAAGNWLQALEAFNRVPKAIIESRAPDAAAMHHEARRRLVMPSITIEEPVEGRAYRGREITLRGSIQAGAGVRHILISANGAAAETLFSDLSEHPPTQTDLKRTLAFREGRNVVEVAVQDASGMTEQRALSFIVQVPLLHKGWFWAIAALGLAAAGSLVMNLHRRQERYRLSQYAERLEREVERATEDLRQSHAALERSHAALAESHGDLEHSHVSLKARSADLTLANARLEAINREIREMQVKLVQSEKMASLGQLVAGLAHELNSPLGVIKANHDVVQRAAVHLADLKEVNSEGDGRFERHLQLIRDLHGASQAAIERVERIVQSLRHFSRLDEAAMQRVDLHVSIESALTLLEYRLRDQVEVVRDYGQIPPITCNPAALNQVFMQLLANAADATQDQEARRIIIRTRADGEWLAAEVEDNGIGIPEEHLSRIFDPGFTTRGVGVGTGLGLAIVYQIVAEHRGEMRVKSRPREGSVFTVRLPRDRPQTVEVEGESRGAKKSGDR
jgi:signal transduction histidine kinase/tetratricopeptide (TPR) repeat protein